MIYPEYNFNNPILSLKTDNLFLVENKYNILLMAYLI